MSRINTNVNALIAQRNLANANKSLTKSLERLSTGVKVNRGSDGPAQLIAGERLRLEKENIKSAIGNAERADLISNIAEGGLQEVNNLLVEVNSLVGQNANDAGLSDDEKKANQLQIDSILQTIDRIATTTSFAGSKLLNGNYAFTTSGVSSSVDDYQINGGKVPDGQNIDVKAIVTASARHGAVFLSTNGALDLTSASSKFVFEVNGSLGGREFSFSSGTALADIADSVNGFKGVTGVSATVQGTGIMLQSTEFGSDNFVSFNIVQTDGQAGSVHGATAINEDVASTVGTNITAFSSVTSSIRQDGQDIQAVINGVAASGKGKTASISTDALDISITLDTAGSQALGSVSALTITGGGARFNLGPTIDIGNQVRLGLDNVAARKLGNSIDGFLSDLRSGGTANVVDGDLTKAQTVVSNASDQISSLRGRIGAFQKNVVQSTINSLGVALENTAAAESLIRDTDFAEETANLTRNQILVSVASQMTGIANSRPQQVLALLG